MFILIVGFIILYFILAWRRLDWAVMFFLVALPSYMIRFSILGIPSTLLEMMILISFTVWLFKNTALKKIIRLQYSFKDYLANRKNRSRYPFDIEIVLVLLVSWLAVGLTFFSDEALGIWKAYFFEPLLVFILILNVLSSKKNLNVFEKILWPLCISAFLISSIAIVEYFTGWFKVVNFWPRVTGPFPYPNALGLFLGPLVLVMIGWLFSKLKITNYKLRNCKYECGFILLSVILSLIAIYFARSEGAVVGILAGLTVFGLLAGKKIRIATIILIMFSCLVVTLYAPAKNYAFGKITLRDVSGEIRKQQWRETWEMMTGTSMRFVFGTGLSNYQKAIAPYHQEGIFYNFENDLDFRRKIVVFDEKYKAEHWQPVEIYMYPHNILLNFWTELGLIGVALFIWIISKFFSQIKNKKNYLQLGLIGAMIVVVVHGLVDVPYFKNDLAVMFWVLIAMAGIIKMGKQNEENVL